MMLECLITSRLLSPYQVDIDAVDDEVSIIHLGVDSMHGMQLQDTLEKKCGFAIPDAIIRDPDASLRVMTPLSLRFHS